LNSSQKRNILPEKSTKNVILEKKTSKILGIQASRFE
jgi:hypothetical protein